tara:strand:- start:1165 stop:2580 length:1416 start_codon:yes stop_codon:yes gene_type:complete
MSYKNTYLPEEDDGRSCKGSAIFSCDMWIPLESIRNVDALLRAATFSTVNTRTGDVSSICLGRIREGHVTVARHLFTDDEWSERIVPFSKPSVQYETVDFGDKITPRNEAQQAAWEAFSKADHGVLNLACGKGKTVMALKKIAQRGNPAIIIVNNSGLMEQWVERATEFLSVTREDIGIVQGKRAEWDKPMVIAMVQTLANRAVSGEVPIEARRRFGTVIFDEVHHLSAHKFSKTAPLFYGARYGLTATPVREDGLEGVYYAQIGGIFYTDVTSDLNADIYVKELNTSPPIDPSDILDVTGEFSVGKLYKFLSEQRIRNEELLELLESALSSGRRVICLTHSKDHPEILSNMIVDRASWKSYKVGVVTGSTPGELRTEIIASSDITFATFQVAKEGLDAPALDTVVFATPFSSWGGFQQGKGRVERNYSGKKSPLAILIDDVKIAPAHKMCQKLRRKIVTRRHKVKVIRAN